MLPSTARAHRAAGHVLPCSAQHFLRPRHGCEPVWPRATELVLQRREELEFLYGLDRRLSQSAEWRVADAKAIAIDCCSCRHPMPTRYVVGGVVSVCVALYVRRER